MLGVRSSSYLRTSATLTSTNMPIEHKAVRGHISGIMHLVLDQKQLYYVSVCLN